MVSFRAQVRTYLDETVRVIGALEYKSKQCIADTFSIGRLLATPV